MLDFEGTDMTPRPNGCGSTLGAHRSCYLYQPGTSLSGFCQLTGSGKLRLTIIGYTAGVATITLPGTAN
jgi:hypothetical protein